MFRANNQARQQRFRFSCPDQRVKSHYSVPADAAPIAWRNALAGNLYLLESLA
jgi:hypothetical protein